MKVSELPIPKDEWTDIGSGVFLKPSFQWRDGDEVGPDDEVWGFTLKHTHPDGSECHGSIPIDPQHHVHWQVQSINPLTLHPSVLQRSGPDRTECLHGFITNGRWVGC